VPTAHFYIFSDACPSDWLVVGNDDVWHTIANITFQFDPNLSPEEGRSHEKLLPLDRDYRAFIAQLQSQLPSAQLRKWGTGPSYRERFCEAFKLAQPNFSPVVSAVSFQESTLRYSRDALLAEYNARIGGIEGRGIGFEESTDARGRRRLKHSFLHWRTGLHEIEGLENQMLALLLMAWFVAAQYSFRLKEAQGLGFDQLSLTVVSDKLSGDDDFRRKSENNLRLSIDPEHQSAPITLTRSAASDTFAGDLIVDNLAGWLTEAMNAPRGLLAERARELIPSGV
jgi:hypothetical protein